MNKKLLSLYGLKWNPFSQEVPIEALLRTPKVESFCWRIEQVHVREGGFALITGEPGTGKSAALRLLAERLSALREVNVGELEHPRSRLADFYRELGDLFGVALKPHNRWAGFKALRERWLAHIEATLVRAVLLIDEAQYMSADLLSELRILTSTHFDSKVIVNVVLAGDGRLAELLRGEELLALGSRMRARLVLEAATVEELLACLKHRCAAAGNTKLMTPELMTTLCEHAVGNYRLLTNMASELLAAAAQRERTELDEKLYLELYGGTRQVPPPVAAGPGSRVRRR